MRRPASVSASAVPARPASTSRSTRQAQATSGRWIFSATTRPSRSTARCTWASDAAAMGSGSISENTLLARTPSSFSSSASMSSTGAGVASSWVRSSAVIQLAGTRSGRVDSAWPSLTKAGPIASRSATKRSASSSVSPSMGSSSASPRSKPVRMPALR
jgi:hypothetical protein